MGAQSMTIENGKQGDPNWAWWEARALVNGYLSNTVPTRELSENEAKFETLLEQHLIYSGRLHKIIRMAFSDNDFDQVNVEIIDSVNNFAKALVKYGSLKNDNAK